MSANDETANLESSLQLLDPLLQFLTKATGRTVVNLQSLRGIIPKNKRSVLTDIPKLVERGILQIEIPNQFREDIESILSGDGVPEKDKDIMVGFPPPSDHFSNNVGANQTQKKQKINGGLHGSTKAAAKRRMAALKRSLKKKKKNVTNVGSNETQDGSEDKEVLGPPSLSRGINPSLLDGMVHNEMYQDYNVKTQLEKAKSDLYSKHESTMTKEGKAALNELEKFLSSSRWEKKDNQAIDADIDTGDKKTKDFILPGQAAYAGSRDERQTKYAFLQQKYVDLIPLPLRDTFGLQLTQDGGEERQSVAYRALDAHKGSTKRRMLYSHQVEAIEAALEGIHTLVCTGTGSGKSMCFLLPVLADVMNSGLETIRDNDNGEESHSGTAALIMFPTKALAQDQLTKLETLIKSNPILQRHIRPGIIDGDTPHQNRSDIAEQCNIILTNPDTLHAAIIPGWKANYRSLLSKLRYIVIDELHTYEGTFGAHVSLVLSRLVRVSKVAHCTSSKSLANWGLVFIGCSATIGHPEQHFRLICPIAISEKIKVLLPGEDGSPCAAKHFFAWNPPLLGSSGDDIGQINVPMRKKKEGNAASGWKRKRGKKSARARGLEKVSFTEQISSPEDSSQSNFSGIIKRRHAADETANLLAHAVRNGIRSIAFCKTRMLAEWVYESCVSILKSDQQVADLSEKVEIYRGGYAASIRRSIESRLFNNEILGVVGTSALELGIDLGGIDLTLHCGYPGSIASLFQQAGRAGRGAAAQGASFSIMVCFSSPSEQHIWRRPKGLLGRGLDAPPSIPLNVGIVQGHILCASEEFPVCGSHSVTEVLNGNLGTFHVDYDLFGGKDVYLESLENLCDSKCVQIEKVNGLQNFITYAKHSSIDKPSLRVSLRSIEPINYSIVDLSHPQQAYRNDSIHDKTAIMDTIPYSRVFYHAYPGAIIMHRGRRYKIQSMNSPPAFASITGSYRSGSSNLGAYAKPSTARYSTRALSITLITIVKQLDRVELERSKSIETQELGSSEKGESSSENKKKDEEAKNKNGTEAEFVPQLSLGMLAGNGVVTVKRTVHGYKKLSLVNRAEISRSEISLPPMEYDTNAMWIDTEGSVLAELMPDYDKGVHALSHAIVAVAPLFVPCTPSDLDCDHSHYGCTKVTLFDVRAGGAGTSSQLWKHFFKPHGVLEAAIDLLSECPSSCDSGSYKGGCPSCIQAVPCINFHEDLSRKAALIIAKRVLGRIKLSKIYIQNMKRTADGDSEKTEKFGTPRRRKREKALRNSHDLVSARNRNIVVGRPSWPTDNSSSVDCRVSVEPYENASGISSNHAPSSPQGGFLKYK